MTRDEQALLVGLGAIGAVGLAAYLLGRDDETAFGAFNLPSDEQIAQALEHDKRLQGHKKFWDKAVSQIRAAKPRSPQKDFRKVARERLTAERADVPRTPEDFAQKDFKKLSGRWFRTAVAVPITLPGGQTRTIKVGPSGAGQETFPTVDTPLEHILRRAHEESALQRARHGARTLTEAEEYQEDFANRRAELRRQEEELRHERVLPSDFSTFVDRDKEILDECRKYPKLGSSQIRDQLRRRGVKVSTDTVQRVMEEMLAPDSKESLEQQWQALRKLRDPDFEFPNEPVWKEALKALRKKGLMVETPDPKDPRYAILDLSQEAKRIFSSPIRSRCSMRVPLGALPADVLKAYRDRGLSHNICGTRSFLTEDGRQALSVQTLRPGSAGGEPLIVTERWSKQGDDSWKIFSDRAQHVNPADLQAAVESASTPVEAERYTIKPLPMTEAKQIANAEEEIRQHEERLRKEVDQYLKTKGANVLAPREATAEDIYRRERLRVRRGGGTGLKPVLDERVNEDFFVAGAGGGNVRIRFYEDDKSAVHRILDRNPPRKVSMADVARQLFNIGAEFARTPQGKPGWEGVYKET